jgi:hypothetical protein
VLGPAIKGVTIRGGEERLARVLHPDVGGAEVPKIASSACKLLRKVQFKSSPVKSSQAAPLDGPATGMSGNQLRVLSIVPVTLIHYFNYQTTPIDNANS